MYIRYCVCMGISGPREFNKWHLYAAIIYYIRSIEKETNFDMELSEFVLKPFKEGRDGGLGLKGPLSALAKRNKDKEDDTISDFALTKGVNAMLGKIEDW